MTNGLYWSKQLYSLLDYKQGQIEVNLEDFIKVIHPGDIDKVMVAINESIKTGSHYRVEHRIVMKDNSIKWMSEEGDVIRNDKGEVIRMLGITQDITIRKEYEHKLEKASKAKSEFLSSMSHELRTPLNAILGFGQLLMLDETGALSVEQRENTEQIMQGGRHLLELINDVLDLAGIESGKLELSLEAISVKRLFTETFNLVQPVVDKYNVHLERTCCCPVGEDSMIYADYLRTKQVLLNLLSNATKYNSKNGTIHINCNIESSNMLRITVSDTGNGISKENQLALFKPFNRLGAERTNIEGTGIGLVVCKELIEKMQGRIGVESEVGKGSSFWFELPMLQQAGPPIENRGFLHEPVISPSINAHLLYIEDNPANIKLMEKLILRDKELRLTTAITAEEGINIAEKMLPDVIIIWSVVSLPKNTIKTY